MPNDALKFKLTTGIKSDPPAPERRRGRPADPRLVALDETLVSIVSRYDRITCRGVFYQAVNVKAVEKTEAASKLVERRLLKLRRAGRIPYDKIVDESRIVYGHQRYLDLADLAEDAARLYRRDYWAHTDFAVQVWVEKRGLAGLLTPTVCNLWGLNLFVAAGQMSETYLYTAGTQIAESRKPTFVYAMTDFDPGGATIFNTLIIGSKAAPGGLSRFTEGVPVYVRQIALTGQQVKEWGLPTRPAKASDTRSKKFVEEHGDVSTELDAIEPERLTGLVDAAIASHMPADVMERMKTVEAAERESLRDVLRAFAGTDDDQDAN